MPSWPPQNGYVGAHGAALAPATIRNGLRDPRPLPDFTTPPAAPKPQPAREPSKAGRLGEGAAPGGADRAGRDDSAGAGTGSEEESPDNPGPV